VHGAQERGREVKWRSSIGLAMLLCAGFPLTARCERPLPFFSTDDFTPYWESESHHSPAAVQPFSVIDQNGKAVTDQTLKGRISLVNFFFGQCGTVCPTMMLSLKKFQSQLKKSGEASFVRFYSFSTMPEQDSPGMLRDYARVRNLDLTNWSLLTGDVAEIYRVGKTVFKADGSVGPQRRDSSFIHTTYLYVVDSQLRIRGIYDIQNPQQMTLLASDLKNLEHESLK
jgi:protein SCO1/2